MDNDLIRMREAELSELARTTLDTGEGPKAASAEPVHVAVVAGQDGFLAQARDQLRQAGLQATLFREGRALKLWLRDNKVDAVLTSTAGAQDQGLTQLALQLQQHEELPLVVAVGREAAPAVKPSPTTRFVRGHVVPALLEAVNQQADARLAKRLALRASGISPDNHRLVEALDGLRLPIQHHPVVDLRTSQTVAELGKPQVPKPFRSMDQVWSLASWSGKARSLALGVLEAMPRRRLPLILQMGELHHVLRSPRFVRAVGRPIILQVERRSARVDPQALRAAGVELATSVGLDAGDLSWIERIQPRMLVIPEALCRQARNTASAQDLVREICAWARRRSLPVLAERTAGVNDMAVQRGLGLRFAAVSTALGGPLK